MKAEALALKRPWIHTPEDGRGARGASLNGVVVDRVVYVDTRRGIVRYVDSPAKIHKHGKRIVTRTAKGIVDVWLLNERTF